MSISTCKNLIVVFAVIVALNSCAGPRFVVIDDPNDDHTTFRINKMSVVVNTQNIGFAASASIQLDMYVSKENSDTSIYLFVTAFTMGGLDIQRGDRIEFDIDGNIQQFPCVGITEVKDTTSIMTKYGQGGEYYLEGGWFKLDKKAIADIAKSKSTRFSIYCVNAELKGKFRDFNIEKISKFNRIYVTGQ